MTRTSLYTLIYGVILIVGGFAGYYQAQSMISLISGSLSGIAFIILSILMMMKKPYVAYIASALAIALTIVFGIRFAKTLSFETAALCLLSAYVVFLCVAKALGKNRYE